jgi:membrane protease YdiL (CAAX protease family)
MDSLTFENHFTKVSPVQSLIFLTLITFTGFAFIGPFFGFLAAIPFFDGGLMEMIEAMTDPINNGSVKVPLFITQAFSTIIGFIILPYLYGIMVLNIQNREIFEKSIPSPVVSLLVMIIVITFMGANSIFIEWNSTLDLPEALSGFEKWARDFEDRAQEITQFLTQFDNNGQFLLALFVIAVLPAIGEEFVFRGLLQNHLQVITKNMHLAVWLAAILFSFFHMQFYGFVPRIILGALFGYLYAWSGNLAYPIIAHFVNNGFTLFMMYLYNKGAVEFDIESTESVPISTVLLSAGITAVLLFVFKGYFRKEERTIGTDE